MYVQEWTFMRYSLNLWKAKTLSLEKWLVARKLKTSSSKNYSLGECNCISCVNWDINFAFVVDLF